MIDWLGREHGIAPIDAYLLCSVAVDLRMARRIERGPTGSLDIDPAGATMQVRRPTRSPKRAEESVVAKYLFHGSYTQAGIKGVLKDGGTGRRKAVDALAKSLGGSIDSMYWAFGKRRLLRDRRAAERGRCRGAGGDDRRVRRGLDQHGRAAHREGHRRRRQAPSRLPGARREVADPVAARLRVRPAEPPEGLPRGPRPPGVRRR